MSGMSSIRQSLYKCFVVANAERILSGIYSIQMRKQMKQNDVLNAIGQAIGYLIVAIGTAGLVRLLVWIITS